MVKSTESIATSKVGFLTPGERRELQIQAARQVRADLAKLKTEKFEEGQEIGERKALLDMAAAIAPAEVTRLNEIESLDDLRREVMKAITAQR